MRLGVDVIGAVPSLNVQVSNRALVQGARFWVDASGHDRSVDHVSSDGLSEAVSVAVAGYGINIAGKDAASVNPATGSQGADRWTWIPPAAVAPAADALAAVAPAADAPAALGALSQVQAAPAVALSAGSAPSPLEGPLPWLLGLGLGLLLAWCWLKLSTRSSARLPRQKRDGAMFKTDLLPPQGLLPRSPHERLHDRAYLQRMLEAERPRASRGDDSNPQV